jgi:hypothetical protein
MNETLAPAEVPRSVNVAQRYIHSDLFERLVKDADDLVGLVAYGLYQQRKREWMAAHEKMRGSAPTEDDLKAHALNYQQSMIDAIKTEAEGILFAFSDEIMEAKKPQMISDALNARTTEELASLRSSIRKISSYRHHIIGHVIGFFVLVGLVVAVTLAIKYEPHLRDWVGVIPH